MAGTPVRIDASTPTQQTATVGTDVPVAPAVVVTDIDGFPVRGVAVTWTVTAGGGSIVVANGTTDTGGRSALTSWTVGASPGTNTVTASVSGISFVAQFQATGTAVVATTIARISTQSQAAPAGTAVPDTPRVRVTGAGGLPAAGVRVTWTITDGGGYLNGNVGRDILDVFTDANGYADCGAWNLGDTPGSNGLEATVPNMALSGEPVGFNGTGQNLGATQIAANSTTSQSAQVSTNVSVPPSVVVTNDLGLGVQNVAVQFAVVAGGGSRSPSTVITDANGVATLTSWTVGPNVGTDNNELWATVGGLAGSPVQFFCHGVAAAPPVAPTTIASNSSTSQSAQVGTNVTAPPSVKVTGAGAAPVQGVVVQFAVAAGGGIITPSNGQVTTDASGVATLTEWRVGPTVGTNNNTVTATVVGLSGSPVTFQASGTAGSGGTFSDTYREALYVPSAEKLYLSGGLKDSAGGGIGISGWIRVFDARTLEHLTDLAVGGATASVRGMVYANGKVYVALHTGNIAVVDVATDTLLTTITIAGAWSHGVYVSSTDRVVFVQDTTGAVIQINPSSDTQSTLIASVAGVGLVTYVPSNDRLYLPTATALAVYNPSTGALVTTIAGNFANAVDTLCAYAAGATEGVWCRATTSGNDRRVVAVDPSTNTVRGYVVVGQSGTVKGGLYADDTDRLYVVVDSTVVTIDASADTVLRTGDAVPGTPTTLTGYIPGAELFAVLTSTSDLPPAQFWSPRTRSGAMRSRMTASGPDAPHVTVEDSRCFAVGSLVGFRRDVLGSYRVRLEWPSQITALNGLRREMLHQVDDARGERNYVRNPWARDWIDSKRAPGWRLYPVGESRWSGRDASTWTSFNAQANGTQSSVTSLNLKSLTPGDVLEPGDYLSSLSRTIMGRAVVDGSGNVTVTLDAAASVTDGVTVTIRRPPAPTFLVDGQGVVGYTANKVDTTESAPRVEFAVPYYDGLTTLWVTLECYAWLAAGSGLQPSTMLRMESGVGGVMTQTFAGDTTTYTDPAVLLGPYVISRQITLTPGDHAVQVRAVLSGAGVTAGAVHIRRVQATLGPEADIAPPMEFNADHGALFHSSQRALADRGQVPVQYELRAAEDPAKRFQIGATVDLRHPARAMVATPRVLRITRTVYPGATAPDDPELELDNLPPSLNRRLSSSGVR